MFTELVKILFAIGIGQSLLLAVILLLPRNESKLARRGLATFLIVMAMMLWDGYVLMLGPDYARWRPGIVYLAGVWLIGPSIWFYVSGLTRGGLARAGLHVVPAFVVFACYVGAAATGHQLPGLLRLAFLFGAYVQVTCYIVLALRELLHHRARLKANLSALGKQSLTWLNILVGSFLGLWLLDFSVVLADVVNQQTSRFAYQLLLLAECGWLLLVAFMALRQPDIMHRQLLVEPARKYRNSALSESAARELSSSLDQLMETDKPHLDNELTLPDLAKRLGVSAHLLSQLLNDTLGCNFYEYINQARVREAQALLQDADCGEMAIIDIAYQAGFNNKNSFNKAFRKYTSLTPSEFRRARLN